MGASRVAAAGKRIPQLDGLRAVAIIAVFFKHALRARMLWMGVDVFFVLSGFLITGILLDLKHKDLGHYFSHFYNRRARRILPPYIILLIVVSLIFGVSWARHWYMYAGLTNYIHAFKNGEIMPFNPLWSLGVEEQFYLVWPFAVFYISEKKLPYVAVALLILAPLARGLVVPFDTEHWIAYKATICRMDTLAMGALLAFAWRSRFREKIERYGYLALIPTLLTPFLMIHLSRHFGYSTVDGTIRGSVITIEIALIAATGTVVWVLGGRFIGILMLAPMRWLGRISYTFYLIHMTTILVAQRYIHRPLVAAAAAATASVAYAAISWYFLEAPILHGGNKKVAAIELNAAEPVPEK